MAKSRCIITTAFGDRTKQLKGFVENIRRFSDLPIWVYADRDYDFVPTVTVEGRWKHHPRYGQRNGDYWQAAGVLGCGYDEVLYLDDDMRIVSADFVQGFELARIFGVCLPLNPRRFIGVDGKIGQDSAGYPEHLSKATAYNCGTMFVGNSHRASKSYLMQWMGALEHEPTRGPMAAFIAAQRTQFAPYVLQDEWCVCGRHAKIEDPIILHCGHEPCMARYKKEFC